MTLSGGKNVMKTKRFGTLLGLLLKSRLWQTSPPVPACLPSAPPLAWRVVAGASSHKVPYCGRCPVKVYFSIGCRNLVRKVGAVKCCNILSCARCNVQKTRHGLLKMNWKPDSSQSESDRSGSLLLISPTGVYWGRGQNTHLPTTSFAVDLRESDQTGPNRTSACEA